MHHQRHLAHHRVHTVAQRHHQRAGDALLAGHELQIAHLGQEQRELGHRAAELDAQRGGLHAHTQTGGIGRRDAEGALGHIELHRHMGRVVPTDRRPEQVGVVERAGREGQRAGLITGHHQRIGQAQIERSRCRRRGKAQDRLILGNRSDHAGLAIDGGTQPVAAFGHAHLATACGLHPGAAQVARHPNPAVVARRGSHQRGAVGADRHPGALPECAHLRPFPVGCAGVGIEDLPAVGRCHPLLAAGIGVHRQPVAVVECAARDIGPGDAVLAQAGGNRAAIAGELDLGHLHRAGRCVVAQARHHHLVVLVGGGVGKTHGCGLDPTSGAQAGVAHSNLRPGRARPVGRAVGAKDREGHRIALRRIVGAGELQAVDHIGLRQREDQAAAHLVAVEVLAATVGVGHIGRAFGRGHIARRCRDAVDQSAHHTLIDRAGAGAIGRAAGGRQQGCAVCRQAQILPVAAGQVQGVPTASIGGQLAHGARGVAVAPEGDAQQAKITEALAARAIGQQHPAVVGDQHIGVVVCRCAHQGPVVAAIARNRHHARIGQGRHLLAVGRDRDMVKALAQRQRAVEVDAADLHRRRVGRAQLGKDQLVVLEALAVGKAHRVGRAAIGAQTGGSAGHLRPGRAVPGQRCVRAEQHKARGVAARLVVGAGEVDAVDNPRHRQGGEQAAAGLGRVDVLGVTIAV